MVQGFRVHVGTGDGYGQRTRDIRHGFNNQQDPADGVITQEICLRVHLPFQLSVGKYVHDRYQRDKDRQYGQQRGTDQPSAQ